MAEMIWVDYDVHRSLKKLARENGSTVQKVASILLRQSKSLDLSKVEFPAPKARGRKSVSEEERALISKRMKRMWRNRRKASQPVAETAEPATVSTLPETTPVLESEPAQISA